jgi:stearoyl-CoA desaturase (delta-9 desaturase)
MKTSLHYTNIVYLVTHHIIALYALYNLPSIFSFRLILEVFLSAQLTGMLGITAGAHRLWSHKSFEAAFPVRVVFMMANSAAHQGSIYQWSRDHKMHHKHTDTELDPHSIQYGFWYSHVGWIFFRKTDAFREASRLIQMDDLKKDTVVMFQHKYYFLLSHLFCFILPTLYGKYMWNSYSIGYVYFGVLRWVLLLHATWCVNSVAHMWGSTPYNPRISSRQSIVTSIIAVGEGWHNYHHTYPYDYRASEFNWNNEWNPTTFLLDSLSSVGLVWNKKVGNPS